MDVHLLQTILNKVDVKTWTKGTQYHHLGMVLEYKIENDFIIATVQGSKQKIYGVCFGQDDDQNLLCVCSCPIGENCKHAVAAALHIIDDTKKTNTLQKAAKNDKIVPLLSPQEKSWLQSLQTSQSKRAPLPPTPEEKDTLLYGLRPSYINIAPLSAIELYQVRLLKTKKGFSKPRQGHTLDRSYYEFSFTNTLVEAVDEEIVNSLLQSKYFPLKDEVAFFQKLVRTQRCFMGTPKLDHHLRWGENKKAVFSWEYDQKDHMRSCILVEGIKITPWLWKQHAFYIDTASCLVGLLELPGSLDEAKIFLNSTAVRLDRAPLLQEELTKIAPHFPPIVQQTVLLPEETPLFCLKTTIIQRFNYSPIVEATFSVLYGQHKFSSKIAEQTLYTFQQNGCLYQLPRSPDKERKALHSLRSLGWNQAAGTSGAVFHLHAPQGEHAEMFFSLKMHELREMGWKVEGTQAALNAKVIKDPKLYGEIFEKDHDWFDLEVGSVIDGKKVNLTEVLPTLLERFQGRETTPNEVYLSTKEGDVILLPFERIKTLLETFLHLLNPEAKEGRIPLSRSMIPLLGEVSEKLDWQAPQRYSELKDKLRKVTHVETTSPPKTLSCELRPYQAEGLSWMQFLAQTELGGILADDMGLGKTVQTLAHILLEKEKGLMKKPALIVAPTSLMGNWLQEANKFAPTLSVLILHGLDRKEHFTKICDYDIVLTTYPLLARDEEILLKQEFYFLILDEAQMIKNAKTKAHQVLRKIQAKHKLCLTGTPMENHLGELWSLFHIILPGFLGTEKQFQSLFRKPIEKEGSWERQSFLQKRIHPFFLRRTKEEVVTDLPPKTEITVPIQLTQKQKDLYEAVRLTMMNKVLDHVKEKGMAQSRIVVLDALLKLRQICCDPRLLAHSSQPTHKEDSAKLSHLIDIVPQMIEEKRQILLFSQFTSMLDLIETELQELSIPYAILTGNTKDRITPIQEFQSGKVPLFLISLKAGGTGLNLTAADTVIHYDPWWNPAVESQATARAHRIGQTKPIFVYKWIASGTVEEKILQLQEKKKGLVSALLDEKEHEGFSWKEEEIYALFAPLEELVTTTK